MFGGREGVGGRGLRGLGWCFWVKDGRCEEDGGSCCDWAEDLIQLYTLLMKGMGRKGKERKGKERNGKGRKGWDGDMW